MSKLENIHAPEQPKGMPKELASLKASLPNASVFAFLEKFDAFSKKKRRMLDDGEVLFVPGEDTNFYVVSAGALRIYRCNPTGEKKEIGLASAGSFLGEWVISGRTLKEVEAVSALPHTEVVTYTKEDLEYLESLSPETMMDLYKHIMNVTSIRLANSGKELALLSEAAILMEEFKQEGERGFFNAMKHIQTILNLDYVIQVEQHPVVSNLLSYKYDTFSDEPIARKERVLLALFPKESESRISDGVIRWTEKDDQLFFLRLANGEELRGYLVLGRHSKKALADEDIRLLQNLSPHLVSIIENNQRMADEKARAMKESFSL